MCKISQKSGGGAYGEHKVHAYNRGLGAESLVGSRGKALVSEAP